MGLLMVFSTVVTGLFGYGAWGSKYLKDNMLKSTLRRLKIHKIHKVAGLIISFIAQITIFLGIQRYNIDTGNQTLGVASISAYLCLWAILEASF